MIAYELTIADVCKTMGVELTKAQMKFAGSNASSVYQNITGIKPGRKRIYYQDSYGLPEHTTVTAYPKDFQPYLENAIRLSYHRC